MIQQNEVVTEKYLSEKFVTKDYLNGYFVTNEYFEACLREKKNDIVNEVRDMMYETMENAMDSMRLHYQQESDRKMAVLREGFRDELRVYKDQVLALEEKVELIVKETKPFLEYDKKKNKKIE